MKSYEIQRTQPTVYLDNLQNAVNGFQVTVYLPEFDETQFLKVPTLDPKTVKKAADQLIKDRRALASLGEDSPES